MHCGAGICLALVGGCTRQMLRACLARSAPGMLQKKQPDVGTKTASVAHEAWEQICGTGRKGVSEKAQPILPRHLDQAIIHFEHTPQGCCCALSGAGALPSTMPCVGPTSILHLYRGASPVVDPGRKPTYAQGWGGGSGGASTWKNGCAKA